MCSHIAYWTQSAAYLQLVTTKPFKEPPREATCYMQLYCSCLVLDPSCSKARFVSLLYEPLQGNKFMKLRSDRSVPSP